MHRRLLLFPDAKLAVPRALWRQTTSMPFDPYCRSIVLDGQFSHDRGVSALSGDLVVKHSMSLRPLRRPLNAHFVTTKVACYTCNRDWKGTNMAYQEIYEGTPGELAMQIRSLPESRKYRMTLTTDKDFHHLVPRYLKCGWIDPSVKRKGSD